MDHATFNEQNDAYVEQRYHGDSPHDYDAWWEEMQETQEKERMRARIKQPPRKMRQYK
jgi:hypothetical protein